MLDRAERYRLLRVIGKCCKFGLLPAQVDLSTWELLPYRSGLKLWTCYLSFLLFVLHVMYKMGSLASAYFLKNTPLQELIIHAILAVGGTVYACWYYVLYIKHPGVFRAYLKMTLTGNIGAMDDQDTVVRSRGLQKYTPQDLIVISLPYLLSCAELAIIMVLIFYPSMKLTLFASLPKEYQTWLTFGILLVEESRYLILFMCIAIPVWTLQVISFSLINSRLQLMINSMQWAARTRRLEQVYRSLRHIQLYVGVVNLINSFLIFSWKAFSIAMAIGTGYAAIAHFSDSPLFGVMYYIIFLDSSFVYLFSYDKAFHIPALSEKMARKALGELRYTRSRPSKIFRLQMRSIPQMGIKVGAFHMMERASTLIFIHYVLTNMVNMLVANGRL